MSAPEFRDEREQRLCEVLERWAFNEADRLAAKSYSSNLREFRVIRGSDNVKFLHTGSLTSGGFQSPELALRDFVDEFTSAWTIEAGGPNDVIVWREPPEVRMWSGKLSLNWRYYARFTLVRMQPGDEIVFDQEGSA